MIESGMAEEEEEEAIGTGTATSSKQTTLSSKNVITGEKWNKLPPATMSQKSKVSPKGPKIGVKKRVKNYCSALYHILSTDQQTGCIPKNTPNNHLYFGTITGTGSKKHCWNVKFDVLPHNDNVVSNITCSKLNMCKKDKEETPMDEHTERFLQLDDDDVKK